MPWRTSLMLIGLALNVWLSCRRNLGEVIGLLEKLLAALAVLQLPLLPRRTS